MERGLSPIGVKLSHISLFLLLILRSPTYSGTTRRVGYAYQPTGIPFFINLGTRATPDASFISDAARTDSGLMKWASGRDTTSF